MALVDNVLASYYEQDPTQKKKKRPEEDRREGSVLDNVLADYYGQTRQSPQEKPATLERPPSDFLDSVLADYRRQEKPAVRPQEYDRVILPKVPQEHREAVRRYRIQAVEKRERKRPITERRPKEPELLPPVTGFMHSVARGAAALKRGMGGTIQLFGHIAGRPVEEAADAVNSIVNWWNQRGYAARVKRGMPRQKPELRAYKPPLRERAHEIEEVATGIGGKQIAIAERLAAKYAASPRYREFQWKHLSEPQWWIERPSEAVPQVGAAILAAVATGGLSPFAQTLAWSSPIFVTEAGNVYTDALEDYRKQGVSEDAAQNYASAEALIVGTVNAAVERLSFQTVMKGKTFGQLFRKDRAVRKVVKDAARRGLGRMAAKAAQAGKRGVSTGAAESLEEVIQGTWQSVVAFVGRRKGMTVEQFIKERGQEFAAAFPVGFLLGAGTTGVFKGPAVEAAKAAPAPPTEPPQMPLEAPERPLAAPKAAEPTTGMATRAQKAQGHILAKELGLSKEQYEALARGATGKTSMADMTEAEAGAFIGALRERARAGLPEWPVAQVALSAQETKVIRKVARSDAVATQVETYAAEMGGPPTDAQARADWIKDLTIVARTAGRFERRDIKLFTRGQVEVEAGDRQRAANALDESSSARYAFGQLEAKTGIQFRQPYVEIGETTTGVINDVAEKMRGYLTEVGMTPRKAALTLAQNDGVATWLYEEDATKKPDLWEKLDEPSKAVAGQMDKILQKEAANEIRELRWRVWDRTGEAPPNAPETALEEGRAAKDAGRLREWIATQTWGTRRYYYMSEAQRRDLVDDALDSLRPPGLQERPARAGRRPKRAVPEAKTRRGPARRARGGSVVHAIQNHWERAAIANATADQLEAFWGNVEAAGLNRSDIQNVRGFVNSAIGRSAPARGIVYFARWLGRQFWRFHFLSPVRSGWFAMRNLLQNLYAGSQMPVKELSKAAVKLTAGVRNPWLKADYAADWKKKLTQKRQLHREFLMQEAESPKQVRNRALLLMDDLGVAAPLSDEANRLLIWPVFHTVAYDAVQAYRAGKITFRQLKARTGLDRVHVTERLMLQRFLAQGNDHAFVSEIAKIKTQNTHGIYATKGRSSWEQTPEGRAFIGLVTYPRLVWEIIYQNGAKPFAQGVQAGNYRMMYRGMTGMIAMIVGSAIAKKILWEVAGRHAYGVIETLTRYTPLNPGVSKMVELLDKANEIAWRAEAEGTPILKVADRIVAASMMELEICIPLCDVYLNYYETRHDVRGVRLWSLVKKKALKAYTDKEGRAFPKAKRRTMEKWQHMIFGGAERPKRPKKKPAPKRYGSRR